MTASQLLGAAAPAPTFEHFVDGDTAATFLGITRRTLLQKVRDGKIPGHALDPSAEKKDWRFLLSELRSAHGKLRNTGLVKDIGPSPADACHSMQDSFASRTKLAWRL